jgi:hypothetical protein
MATTKATKSEALVETPKQVALERPAFIKEGDVRGTENITSNDIRPPALRIAQAMTPEAKRTESVYVEGLHEGLFFNSVTKEVYGEGPLGIVVINQLGHRHVEFAPMGEGGGVVDFNVPDGDPRTEFTTETRDGKEVRVKPRATKFYDYLILAILEDGRRVMMTLSFKSTQLKKALQLNTILKSAHVPSFGLMFRATPVPEKRGTYSFFGWRIDHTGYVTEAIYNAASVIYDQMAGKSIIVEAEPDEEVVTDGNQFA